MENLMHNSNLKSEVNKTIEKSFVVLDKVVRCKGQKFSHNYEMNFTNFSNKNKRFMKFILNKRLNWTGHAIDWNENEFETWWKSSTHELTK